MAAVIAVMIRSLASAGSSGTRPLVREYLLEEDPVYTHDAERRELLTEASS
jgi:hypothetical protein